MGRDILKKSVVGLICLGVIGCAGQLRFNAKENVNLSKIAILTIPQPQHISGVNLGYLIWPESEKTNPMTKLLTEADFDFSKELQEELEKQLTKQGYQISFAKATHDDPRRLMDDYNAFANLSVDAALDAVNGDYFGYSNVDYLNLEFRPHLDVKIRLGEPGRT